MAETAVVTLLFTDLVGSTELAQRLGEDGAEVLRRQHTAALREAVAAGGGTEVKHLGDGLMVVFTSPSEAASCAVAMQQLVDRHNRKLREPLGLRVGLHVGEVTREEGDYFGTAVVVAERLCKRADGGQIFGTDVLRALVGTRGGHTFKEIGPLELKGIDEAITACELHWAPSVEQRIPFPSGFPEVDRLLFVGREDERERLRVVWKQAAAGRRQLALLGGEPGIGKTRLCTELALDAHDQGGIVLFGRCDEDLGVPYQPLAEAVRHYITHCPVEELRDHVADFGGEIGRLAPEVYKRLPDAPKPEAAEVADPQADRDVERFRIFESVAGLLQSAAAAAPLLLVLDDLHWASRPTLLLLRHLLRKTEPCAICIVGTYRDTDLARTHPFAETLADLRRELDVERIALAGLDEDGVAAFVRAVSGQDIGDVERALVHAVHAETEGNPFFVGQVLRHLVETGALFERDGRWTYEGPVERLGIPEGVREVIGRRMSRLSEDANRALGVAAVIGTEFDMSVLERVPDASGSGDVLDALDEAVRSRIIDEVAGLPGHYRFTHTLVRQTLYEELTSARRVRVHERVGDAIETIFRNDITPHLSSLARHFAEAARSGHVETAVDYALRAARDALTRSAYEEAEELVERGLQVLDLDDTPRHLLRADLLTALGEARTFRLNREGMREALFAAADAARAAESPERLARAARWIGGMAVAPVQERYDACVEALEGLGDDHPKLRSHLLSLVAFLGPSVGRVLEIDETSREALAEARRVGDPETLSVAIWVRLGLRTAVGPATLTVDEARALADELVGLGRAEGNRFGVAQGTRSRANNALIRGDLAEFRSQVLEQERLVAELRFAPMLRTVESWHVAEALVDGRFEDAAARLADMRTKYREDPTIAIGSTIQFGVLRSEQRGPRNPAALAAMLDMAPRSTGWRGTIGWTHATLGETDKARVHLDAISADDYALLRSDREAASGLANTTYLCALLEAKPEAARLYDLGLPHSGRILTVFDSAAAFGAGDRFLGILATTIGNLAGAEKHFRAALELEDKMPSPPLAARTRYWFARMLIERDAAGDAKEAEELLGRCARTARELGMQRLEQDATELLAT